MYFWHRAVFFVYGVQITILRVVAGQRSLKSVGTDDSGVQLDMIKLAC